MLDLYCERTGPGLLAEPVNTITNAAFFIAAWAAWTLVRRMRSDDAGMRTLIALVVTIGAGSTLFHVFASGWARALDEVPILLFQLCYVWLYQRGVVNTGIASASASVAGYLAAALLARQFPHLLNGSLVYAPALLVMLALALDQFLRARRERFLLATAALLFIASLVFRVMDEAACAYLPLGTHFFWHVLNGVVLYLCLRAIIFESTRVESATPQPACPPPMRANR